MSQAKNYSTNVTTGLRLGHLPVYSDDVMIRFESAESTWHLPHQVTQSSSLEKGIRKEGAEALMERGWDDEVRMLSCPLCTQGSKHIIVGICIFVP